MDVNLGEGMDGIEATRQIRTLYPEADVIGLSMHSEDSVRAAMLAAGASDYLSKGGEFEALIDAIRARCCDK